jgi:hypothetical protein
VTEPDKIERRKRMAKQTGKCAFCKPHSGENGFGRKPRPDKRKNKRRKR